MSDEFDPVDAALQSLRARDWPGGSHNLELENKLMRAFDSNRSVPFVARHRVLVPALAVLLLGSVVFAAAGGVNMVKGWFLTATIEVDGDVVAVEDLVLDEDGKAIITLPPGALEAGEEITVTLEGEAPGSDSDGTEMRTIEVNLQGDVAQIQMGVEEDDGQE